VECQLKATKQLRDCSVRLGEIAPVFVGSPNASTYSAIVHSCNFNNPDLMLNRSAFRPAVRGRSTAGRRRSCLFVVKTPRVADSCQDILGAVFTVDCWRSEERDSTGLEWTDWHSAARFIMARINHPASTVDPSSPQGGAKTGYVWAKSRQVFSRENINMFVVG